MREKKQAKEKAPFKKKAGKRGITQKLTGTIILTIAVMVADPVHEAAMGDGGGSSFSRV